MNSSSGPRAVIPCSNPRSQYETYRAEIDEAVARVMANGRYILGPEVQAFEEEFARYCGTGHAVSVASGTDALLLALRALDIGPGREVITVSNTAVATVAAIELAGATPVLVDVDSETLSIDVEQVERAITDATRAIVAVHLFGTPASLDRLSVLARDRGVILIEDCAQAHGARHDGRRVGSIGRVGCFSFYPTKNLGAIGDGGAIVTSDADLAARIRSLREYGWRDRYVSAEPGMNSRLDELQAAILRVKLRGLDADNERRRERAARYGNALHGVQLTAVPDTAEPVFHLYVVRSGRRDELQRELAEEGIQTMIHYPVPIHLQAAYRGRIRTLPMPVTEHAARTILSLPMYPELPIDDIDRVAAAVSAHARSR